MFTQEGNVQLIIGEIAFDDCQFADGTGPNDFDICIEVTHADDPNQHDWARMEWSENYGNAAAIAHLTQRELTLQTLHKVGFEGDDLTKLPEMLPSGTKVPGRVKATHKNDRTYYTVYLGKSGGNAPKNTLDMEELNRRLAGSAGSGSGGDSGAAASGASGSPFA